jgi:Protein of unknown function (DUF5663)
MDPVTGGQPQIQPQPAPQAPQADPVQAQPTVQQPGVGASQQAPMPQLNDQFLQDVGLGVLPDNERAGMLEQMRKTLETNVGMEIYKNLQEHQLQEFEGFMPLNDENGQVITSEDTANANAQRWLDVNVPGWRQNQQLQPYLTDPARIRDFAAMNWLQRNFPAYRNVVSAELNKLMTEVRNNVPQIIEAVMGPQPQMAQPQPMPQAPVEQAVPQYPPMDQQPPVAPAA